MEKEMATHSSVLAWRIPGTVEPGGLLSVGSHRVGSNWSDLAATAAAGGKKTEKEQQNNKLGFCGFIAWSLRKHFFGLSWMFLSNWDRAHLLQSRGLWPIRLRTCHHCHDFDQKGCWWHQVCWWARLPCSHCSPSRGQFSVVAHVMHPRQFCFVFLEHNELLLLRYASTSQHLVILDSFKN